MKITIPLNEESTVDVSRGQVIVKTSSSPDIEGCYTGVGIKTDQGHFGIAMRDDGVEVMLDGTLVWSSTCALGNAPVSDESKLAAWQRCLGSREAVS